MGLDETGRVMNLDKNNYRIAGCLLAMLMILLPASMLVAAELETEPVAINLEEVEWGPPGGGDGFPVGVRTARMGVDPVTGGPTYFAMFPAGSHFDLHWHSYDEFVSVQQGSVVLELGGEIHTLHAGAYVVIPGKMNHSWDVPEHEAVVILVRRAGPADFNFVPAQ
jgi:mannose-6-phosphate isomerase-like protein (cupin superfamily)